MALSRHVDDDEILKHSRDHSSLKHFDRKQPHLTSNAYAARLGAAVVPRFRIPSTGMEAAATYQVLHDQLALDGTPALNLASFVTTFMPEEGRKLYIENTDKNLADQDEYPETFRIQTRCVSMIANLWNVPKECKAIGTATGGSSEAILLGGLAMKRLWQERRKAEGKDPYHPNIIFGTEVHCSVEKFACYFDVEARKVPITKESRYCMDPKEAIKLVDENTIGVIMILGTTYNGSFEDIRGMSELLDEHEAKTGISVPIHVDAASGGMVAPFVYPKHKWSFDIKRVHSINTSGHKYGMTYVGLGWIIWKDESLLPKDLIFELHYLGNTEYSFNLNFSRPAAPVIGQMFNFLHLGFEGYRNIVQQDLRNARLLSRALESSTYYEVLSEIHRPLSEGLMAAVDKAKYPEDDARTYRHGLPVVAFTFSESFKKEFPHVKQEWIQNLLRQKGWIVPNYPFSANCQSTQILRVVVRESMNVDFIQRLFVDIVEVTESLMKKGSEAHMLAVVAGQEQPAQNPKIDLGSMTDHNTKRDPDTSFSRIC